jgi:hypothetical protein
LQIVPRKMALVHQSKCKLNFLSSSGLPACPYVHTTQLSTISEKVQWSLLPLFPSSPHWVEIISEKAFFSSWILLHLFTRYLFLLRIRYEYFGKTQAHVKDNLSIWIFSTQCGELGKRGRRDHCTFSEMVESWVVCT